MDSSAVTTISRQRDALIALGAGLLGFIAGFAGRAIFDVPRPALGVLICVVLIAAVAASVSVHFLPLGKLPRAVGLPLAGRTGARAGLMASFLAAGYLVMGVYLGSGIGVLWVWLPALLSILPGTLAAIFTATGLVSRMKLVEDDVAPPRLIEESGGRGWVAGVVVLGIFGFLSPLVISVSKSSESQSSVPPPAAKFETAPRPIERPAPEFQPATTTAPVVPAFEFKPDPALTKSRPEAWELVDTRPIPELDSSEPVALSPDQTQIAGLETGSGGMKVMLVNLRTLQRVQAWRLPGRVGFMAFSENGKRLVVMHEENSPHLSLLEGNGNQTLLPVVEPLPLAELGIEWRNDSEVAIHRRGKQVQILNLDTLLLSEDSGKGFSVQLPSTETWQLSVVPQYQTASLPPPSGSVKNWKVARAASMAIRHPREELARIFPEITLQGGERFLITSDGSTLLQLNRSGARICYFKSRTPLPLDYEVTMPRDAIKITPGSQLNDPTVRAALHIMVYAPLEHPLTHKCLGPDRNHILARARVVSWEGTLAKVRLTEFSGSLPQNSVFADPHLMNGESLELADMETSHRWWVQVGQPASSGASLTDAGALPFVHFMPDRGTFVPGAFEWALKRPDIVPVIPSVLYSTEVTEVAPGAPPDTDSIRDFVMEHHRKASAGDWEAAGRDYDGSVNYFEKGLISQPEVTEDLRQYHTKFRVKETVRDPLMVKALRNGSLEVRYDLVSEISSQATPFDRKITKVVLILRRVQGGFRILSHNPKR
jgi:hypothetical protein